MPYFKHVFYSTLFLKKHLILKQSLFGKAIQFLLTLAMTVSEQQYFDSLESQITITYLK